MRKFFILTVSCFALPISACSGEKSTETGTPSAETEIAATATATEVEGDSSLEENAINSKTEAEIAKLAADNLEASKTFLAENALREEITVLPSGLQYEILETGPKGSPALQPGDIVDIDYTWSHSDGTIFDSSKTRGGLARTPLIPALGKGIFEGMSLMNIGDRYRFTLPSDLAFGETGTPDGIIGPNEALIFEVNVTNLASSPSANLNKASTFLSENAQKEGIKTTKTGLQYKILSKGSAETQSPTPTNTVRVHYKGTLVDGTEFDSSYERGEPIEFGVQGVIPGWTEGLQLMSVGDKFQFFIPPELGYGERGTPGGPIGPNEALIFEVELLEVK